VKKIYCNVSNCDTSSEIYYFFVRRKILNIFGIISSRNKNIDEDYFNPDIFLY